LTLINNILDLLQIESNKIEFERLVFDLIIEFENVIENHGVKVLPRRLSLILTFPHNV